LLGIWLFLEWQLVHVPNTLLKKRTLLEQRAPNLRVLVAGSSLEYGGVAPISSPVTR
jgi:hypothetical protein